MQFLVCSFNRTYQQLESKRLYQHDVDKDIDIVRLIRLKLQLEPMTMLIIFCSLIIQHLIERQYLL